MHQRCYSRPLVVSVVCHTYAHIHHLLASRTSSPNHTSTTANMHKSANASAHVDTLLAVICDRSHLRCTRHVLGVIMRKRVITHTAGVSSAGPPTIFVYTIVLCTRYCIWLGRPPTTSLRLAWWLRHRRRIFADAFTPNYLGVGSAHTCGAIADGELHFTRVLCQP